MFTLLESKSAIASAQRKLEAAIRQSFKNKATANIGDPSGTLRDAKVITNGRHWYWSADREQAANPRRLNLFGLMPEAGGKGVNISVEINTPYEGKSTRLAGFFGRDNESGQVYLFHSGRVGGGTKGVSKEPFLAWTGHRLVEVFDSDGNARQGVLVMPVEGLGAAQSAVQYIESIVDFKRAVRQGETSTETFKAKTKRLKEFYDESHGRRQGRRSSRIDYVSRHGEVVQALHEWLKEARLQKGQRVVKDVLIDLGVAAGGNRLIAVYEVKTSIDRQSIYTALGQLFVHGDGPDCKRVMVLPGQEKLAPDLAKALVRNGVELMRYDLTETDVVIR